MNTLFSSQAPLLSRMTSRTLAMNLSSRSAIVMLFLLKSATYS